MHILVYRALLGASIVLTSGAVVMGAAWMIGANWAAAAVVWCLSSAGWAYGLYRCFGEPTAQELETTCSQH